jgi:hypothetical protein
MSRRVAGRLAWTLVTLAAVLMSVTVVFMATGPLFELLLAVIFLAFGVVGALIVSRHPRNAIGWLFVTVSVGGGLLAVVDAYPQYAAAREGSATAWAGWVSTWAWLVPFGLLFVFFPLLFPDGRLPSPRWRPYAWFAGGLLVAGALMYALDPGSIPEVGLPNPVGVEALAGSRELADGVGLAGFLVAAVVSFASLALRFRRSNREARQQIKWFLLAIGLLLLTVFLTVMVELMGIEWLEWAGNVFAMSLAGVPVATGIAILKYRLYDIDRVINRTVVYGLLTAALVGIYVGAVAGIGSLARAATGQESSLVIVVSTLAVAALFRPLRARFQTFIDRRFYRQRYDAAATLDGFSARLRDQVDLESLRGEIVGVVGTTMQPAHASVWLRPREDAR